MQFETYEKMCDEFIQTKSNEIFGNFGSNHAKYILNQLIKNANRSISILAQNFLNASYDQSNEFYNNLKKKANYLPSGSVRIITINGIKDDIFENLEQEVNENKGIESKLYVSAKYSPQKIIAQEIDVKKISKPSYRMDSFSKDKKEYDSLNVFVVCDGSMYRLEDSKVVNSDFKEELPKHTKAEVCYNNPKKALQLEDFFNEVWNKLNHS